MFVRTVEESFEVIKCAIFRSHIDIVRDIIAHIELRRGEVGREPDGIDAQILEIIQFFCHADEITTLIGWIALRRAKTP